MTSPPSLGYVILYVNDVAASLHFYEQAFGLARRFFNDEEGKAYGELESGPARLAFASLALAREHLGAQVVQASPSGRRSPWKSPSSHRRWKLCTRGPFELVPSR